MKTMRGIMIVLPVLWMLGGVQAEETPRSLTRTSQAVAQSRRAGYAVGFELGRRLADREVRLLPQQVAAAVAAAQRTEEGDPSDFLSTPAGRLGRRIAALRPAVSADAVAQGMSDAFAGNTAQIDAQMRQAVLSKMATRQVRQVPRSGYGWYTPESQPAALRPYSTIRTSSTGRLEAETSRHRVGQAVQATERNTASVDEFQPLR